jgi:hypothetical protein
LGVNIKDEHGRTPIHSAFRLSNTPNSSISEPENRFKVDGDFGEQVTAIHYFQNNKQLFFILIDSK